MRQFLRTVRQARWHKYPEIDWLVKGELQGDALADMRTDGGRLSVYRIDNEDDLQRVITALAATRDSIANLDYAIFEDSGLGSLGITIRQTDGNTADIITNGLHYELGNLSVSRLARLAKAVSAGMHDRILEKQIGTWLQEAASAGHLDKTRIKSKKIQNALQWYTYTV